MNTIFKVFWYDLFWEMNIRFIDCKADALTPRHRPGYKLFKRTLSRTRKYAHESSLLEATLSSSTVFKRYAFTMRRDVFLVRCPTFFSAKYASSLRQVACRHLRSVCVYPTHYFWCNPINSPHSAANSNY